jgi:hypothetical protein
VEKKLHQTDFPPSGTCPDQPKTRIAEGETVAKNDQGEPKWLLWAATDGLVRLPTRAVIDRHTAIETNYLTAKQAAQYLNIPYDTFRKKATTIPRCPQTKRYSKADLDNWAKAPKVKAKR